MPYNNTPIAPPKEPTGQVALPLARVKKIIHADDDITNCSNNAAFVITLATEMFVQYFVEQAFNAVKAEKKPRKNLQYKDVATVVSRVDNLEFLSDVVPKTVLFKKVKDGKAKGAQKAEKTSQPNGKTPVEAEETNGEAKPDEEREPSEPEEREESGDEMDVDDNDDKNYRSSVRLDGPVQMEMEIRGSRSSARLSGRGRPSINGAPGEDEGEEVESADNDNAPNN